MFRRPPRFTLFPTRRSSDLVDPGRRRSVCVSHCLRKAAGDERSEEHTSELQSRGHLVCRLLLEKKKEYSDSSRSSLPKTSADLTVAGGRTFNTAYSRPSR